MIPSTYLKLVFDCNDVPALYMTEFYHARLGAPRRCIRGTFALPVMDCRAFPWTAGVKGLCILLLRHLLYAGEETDLTRHPRSSLSGCAGSPASSLDMAISRQPAWLHGMFGVDSNGDSLFRHFVCRINPERKRPGPTVLSIKPTALPAKQLSIILGEELAGMAKAREILEGLEASWGFSREKRCASCRSALRPCEAILRAV